MKWENLPVEIQERMLQEQERQTGVRNAEVFKKDIHAGEFTGGFTYRRSKEGGLFWGSIIDGNLDVFFERYPRDITYDTIKDAFNDYPLVKEVGTDTGRSISLYINDGLSVSADFEGHKVSFFLVLGDNIKQWQLNGIDSVDDIKKLIKTFNGT